MDHKNEELVQSMAGRSKRKITDSLEWTSINHHADLACIPSSAWGSSLWCGQALYQKTQHQLQASTLETLALVESWACWLSRSFLSPSFLSFLALLQIGHRLKHLECDTAHPSRVKFLWS